MKHAENTKHSNEKDISFSYFRCITVIWSISVITAPCVTACMYVFVAVINCYNTSMLNFLFLCFQSLAVSKQSNRVRERNNLCKGSKSRNHLVHLNTPVFNDLHQTVYACGCFCVCMSACTLRTRLVLPVVHQLSESSNIEAWKHSRLLKIWFKLT